MAGGSATLYSKPKRIWKMMMSKDPRVLAYFNSQGKTSFGDFGVKVRRKLVLSRSRFKKIKQSKKFPNKAAITVDFDFKDPNVDG